MKIALLGYGRMGQLIHQMVEADGKHSVVLTIHAENAATLTMDALREADVAIDFSVPDSAVQNINLALSAGLPVVSGTTGWLQQWEQVTEKVEATNGAFLYAANFSIGVNLFFALNKKLAELMAPHDYDVSIKETHHIHKKDAPSGTAIALADEILKNVKSKERWVLDQATTDKELLILAERKDEVTGTHSVQFQSSIDSLTIQHEAYNRNGFASGALLAAEWLIGKRGIFTMQDVLGL